MCSKISICIILGGEAANVVPNDTFACRCECDSKFTVENKRKIISEFRAFNHEKQNIYLRGCVKIIPAAKRRHPPRTDEPKPRSSFEFTVTVDRRSIKCCKGAFCHLHNIKRSRLTKKVLNFTASLADGRGKHDNHPKVTDEVRNKMREHIRSFPARESHYSRSKNEQKKYLDANLSITKMHQLLLKDQPNLEGAAKYWLYEDIFNHEFNISFGYPRSDICDTCEKFYADIKKSEVNNEITKVRQLKVEHELHVRRGDAFNTQLKEMMTLAKEDDSIHVLAMDYQKNLPLPLTGIGQEYYKRQLWLHNLGMHDVGTKKATMFVYAEHYAKKGPNETISCLKYYISQLSVHVKHLHIFADNCFSQNKSKYMVAFIYMLAHTRFTSVTLHYPIPGHSRMPCDRDFGRIEKLKRREDKVLAPSQWVRLIRNADKKSPFEVLYVNHPLTDDMQDDGTPVVKVLDVKSAFEPLITGVTSISKLRCIAARRGEAVKTRQTMTGICSEKVGILKRGTNIASLKLAFDQATPAYDSYLAIKDAKVKDVKSLLIHVFLPDSVTFYNELRSDADNPVNCSDEEVE